MSIDLPPPNPDTDTVTVSHVIVVPRIMYFEIAPASSYYFYPSKPEAITSEKRAAIAQQEGMRRAKMLWGRHDGESRGVRRGSRPGRVERGYGAQAHAAKGWERKRKAVLATFR